MKSPGKIAVAVGAEEESVTTTEIKSPRRSLRSAIPLGPILIPAMTQSNELSLLAGNVANETPAALGAAAAKNVLTGCGGHARTESVTTGSLGTAGLIRALHNTGSFRKTGLSLGPKRASAENSLKRGLLATARLDSLSRLTAHAIRSLRPHGERRAAPPGALHGRHHSIHFRPRSCALNSSDSLRAGLKPGKPPTGSSKARSSKTS